MKYHFTLRSPHCQFVKSSLPQLVVTYNSFLTSPVSLVFVSSNSAKTGSKLLCWKAQDVRWHKTPVPQKLNPPNPFRFKATDTLHMTQSFCIDCSNPHLHSAVFVQSVRDNSVCVCVCVWCVWCVWCVVWCVCACV